MKSTALPTVLLLFSAACTAFAQRPAGEELTLQTNAVGPARFVAAHGERALVMGYSGMGLEAWAYPFQLFSDYRLQFLPQGEAAAIDADAILRRIEYRPDEVVRVYVGPDFEVRERLFVPVDQPGVILTYETTGRRAVDIRARFLPVLNLMWPAGLGGQDLRWSQELSGYAISEATTGFRAVIASPQVSGHTAIVNSTLRQDLTQTIVLHPSDAKAEVFATLEEASSPAGSGMKKLEQEEDALRTASRAHVNALLAHGIRIRTPDEEFNRALTWSRIALDQSWVCNPRIGCGIVAGYGPSRGMRRPQYAWFFGGDGLVATRALLAAGDTDRAREELEFILKYQNRSNGMIWHEMSQSAGFLDWAGKYPYMYVHVDITFAFLSGVAEYYAATGDLKFLQDHWRQIAAAYAYCRSVVNPQTALPQIPAGKEGGNEQERMSEDVGLSADWIAASEAYRQLALAAGHTGDAAQAEAESRAARQALSSRYWDAKKQFWIAGFSESGAPMTDQRSHPGLMGHGLFTPEEENAALSQLASADFETDWGTRGMSEQSPHYDPGSYGSGSVSALLTSEMAEAFWRDHQPAIAWPVWKSLLPWLHLDSLGHIHELLAGDVYHPQVESVPEQTWSSAGFLHAAIHGIFGIEPDVPHHRLVLAPHLDPRWAEVSLEGIPVGGSEVTARLGQKEGETDATLSAEGGGLHVSFAPEIPLGATNVHATVDGRAVPVSIERHAQDEHARVEIDVARADARCSITYSGGVRVLAPAAAPLIGEPSRQLKLTSVQLDRNRLALEADVATSDDASLEIQSSWKIGSVDGGSVVLLGDDRYCITFTGVPAGRNASFIHRHLTVDFRTP